MAVSRSLLCSADEPGWKLTPDDLAGAVLLPVQRKPFGAMPVFLRLLSLLVFRSLRLLVRREDASGVVVLRGPPRHDSQHAVGVTVTCGDTTQTEDTG